MASTNHPANAGASSARHGTTLCKVIAVIGFFGGILGSALSQEAAPVVVGLGLVAQCIFLETAFNWMRHRSEQSEEMINLLRRAPVAAKDKVG